MYEFSRTHVTHQLMSNLAPLQIHAGGPPQPQNSARNTQRDESQAIQQNENRPLSSTYKISSKPPTPKPWRP